MKQFFLNMKVYLNSKVSTRVYEKKKDIYYSLCT